MPPGDGDAIGMQSANYLEPPAVGLGALISMKAEETLPSAPAATVVARTA
ncbi:hypothetical protein [Streptomyces sp. NPDC057428]